MAKPRLKLVGLDPSLRNWGLAVAYWDGLADLTVTHLNTICPVLPTGKQVRKNSVDLESATQLYKAAVQAVEGAHAVFVEVPVGSQSARAMASYGICVGVLGAMRANGVAFFEVTPTEVKLAGPGSKTASKDAMIAWAMQRHPEAAWPTHRQHGQDLLSAAKAEHQADAVAAIHAGLNCNAFKQVLPFLKAA